jgi:hypothetical protein
MSEQPRWQEHYDATHLRDVPFETMSGVPVDPVHGDEPLPGQYPFTRGLHAAGYRSRLWTMRMFAGFGTAEDTNARFKEILRNGGTGLSTAFDMPTLMGYDSDSPWALGEVGRAGVAVDTLRDMEDLYADIDLSSVSTSMTINGPAAAVLAMYIAVGEKSGVARADLAGTIQNDILKEYQAQKEYIYPPRPPFVCPTPKLHSSGRVSMTTPSLLLPPLHRRPAIPSMTSVGPSSTAPRSPGCSPSVLRSSPPNVPKTEPDSHVTYTHQLHRQR